MHADVLARWKLRPVLIPELRRLVDDIPLGSFAALTENSLLRPRALLVASDADDDRLEFLLRDHLLERLRLQRGAADQSAALMTHTLRERRSVLTDDQLKAEFPCEAIAILDHLGD